MTVRVRFAPSNTGFLHMGNTRTGLFNFLFARNHEGAFILRIEDTDLERSEQRYADAIIDTLDWLGMSPDEGPVYQTQRTTLYKEAAQQLLGSGNAYRCYCSPEEIERDRAAAWEEGRVWRSPWRDRGEEDWPEDADTPYVVRVRAPEGDGEFVIEDLVQGEVRYAHEELDDFVILRADGSPTYNFVVVVDDVDMKITHVIRGKDHLTNTFRQLVVYGALDAQAPQFGHLPLISGLSKRKGSAGVFDYRDRGFLREAIINYLARLGWSHGDQELFSLDELCQHFSFDHVGKSNSEFDEQKFLWVNEQWMKRVDLDDLTERWRPFLKEAGLEPGADTERLRAICELMRPRAQTLVEMAEGARYFFEDPDGFDDKAAKKWLKASLADTFDDLIGRLDALDTWDTEHLESLYRAFCEEKDLGLGKLAQPTRVSITGNTASPGLFETLELIGKAPSLTRMRRGLEHMQQRAAAASDDQG